MEFIMTTSTLYELLCLNKTNEELFADENIYFLSDTKEVIIRAVRLKGIRNKNIYSDVEINTEYLNNLFDGKYCDILFINKSNERVILTVNRSYIKSNVDSISLYNGESVYCYVYKDVDYHLSFLNKNI